MSVVALIPSRYESSRFPGKPMAMIAGVPMIELVCRSVAKCSEIDYVAVATDDERIANCVMGFGVKVIMTGSHHETGSDRIAEAAHHIPDAEFVINVQGDEPLIERTLLSDLVVALKSTDAQVVTAVSLIDSDADFSNPNVVKVVMRPDMSALYFSRSTIPFRNEAHKDDGSGDAQWYKHIGVYGFRIEALKKFAHTSQTPLERIEKLEQLRMLELGMKVQCISTQYQSVAVDVPQDIPRVEELIARLNAPA